VLLNQPEAWGREYNVMLERDMEGMIARFPEDFFPGHGLVLTGRQQAFAGIGRFDLMFVDRFQTKVLMELKAVTAKYENATQLAKYKEALEALGESGVLMWLVAPSVPNAVREFLDRIGIEYTEIHEVQFRRVAERHGAAFTPPPAAETIRSPRPRDNEHRSAARRLAADLEILPSIDKKRLESLIGDFESVAKRRIDVSLAVNLRKEVIEKGSPSLSGATVLQLARWCKTNSPVYWDGMEIAKEISKLLFGRVLDREALGT
jgi:hypothetical protein